MDELVKNYKDLFSVLASLFAIVGAIIGLGLFWWVKKTKAKDDEHKYIVEKRSFEINNMRDINTLGWHTGNDTISIHTLKSIYNDPVKSEELAKKYAGTYDQLYIVISLHREKGLGNLQANVVFWFCISVVLVIVLSVYNYKPN